MTTRNNLPAEVSSFVGRERELAELRRLLQRSRLLTLTGPGGAGKTRLALRVAREALEKHRDGVWLVELAPVTDPRLLEQSVASSCGIREHRRRPIDEVLVRTLAPQRVLLVLDGCEHLVDECARLVDAMLRACPRLAVVVTSREPLGLPGEVVWRTPSLSVPQDGAQQRPELLLQSEAVRLFIERARQNRPHMQLDASASPVVAQICTRLEGMPLAIELAAGLTRVLTFDDILTRLKDRFRLLTGGSRTALPRHQTLRAAVDWSYGLLSIEERDLLARLSVFAGGFELAAAEAVAADWVGDAGGMLPMLSRLVDKSLVVAEHDGESRTRYRMLDTIREYAHEKLAEGEEAEVRRRHSGYYAEWCARAQNELRAGDQKDWLRRLDDEQGNVRLALEWCLAESPEDALRLAASMDRYWIVRCRLAEATDWLDRVIELAGADPGLDPMARAGAYLARAHIRWMRGEYAGGQSDAFRSRDLSQPLGPSQVFFGGVTLLAILTTATGDWDAAARLHEEAFQVAWQLKEPWFVGSSLNNLALIAMVRGDHVIARSRLDQALTSFRQAGDRFVTGLTLDSLARVNLKLQDRTSARSNFSEALSIAREFHDTVNASTILEGVAMLELEEGRIERAVQLLGAADQLRKPIGVELSPEWKTDVDDTIARARERLTKQAFDAEWKRGGAMTLDEAIGFATGTPPRAEANGHHQPLTLRERQVAELIAQGLTNADIAVRLKMAERTADAHVEHIRNKLGLRTRSQIAVWAHERLGTTTVGTA